MDKVKINGKVYIGEVFDKIGFVKIIFLNGKPSTTEHVDRIDVEFENGVEWSYFNDSLILTANGDEYIYGCDDNYIDDGWMRCKEEYGGLYSFGNKEYERKIGDLEAQNEMLTEVILEMSEILYA